ncbi:conserved hypothetical protein [Rhodococcus phage E3]|uniref:hypothetical protein n=1 Tax=Rhodococcus phage E3 TaxID=1007869 RepID=UPI0002C6DEC1|nr:hypothetical protein M176_gp168 [Rhodococcus phage E3]AEQ21076.1 conserved hypothetical protein [Rhodococcus phage E3]
MTERLGDMAARVADDIRSKQLSQLEGDQRELGDDARSLESDARSELFTKIDFRWRSSDQMALERIRGAVSAMFAQEFASSIAVLDELYATVRVPEVNEWGVVKVDAQNRPVWLVGTSGQPVEDWNRLTGQDIEAALFRLQHLAFSITQQVNDLQTDALFAKYIYDEVWEDAYSDVVEGTVRDREARAGRKARQEKYVAFFRYALWSSSDTFKREVDSFRRLLERTLSWNVWNNPNAGRG